MQQSQTFEAWNNNSIIFQGNLLASLDYNLHQYQKCFKLQSKEIKQSNFSVRKLDHPKRRRQSFKQNINNNIKLPSLYHKKSISVCKSYESQAFVRPTHEEEIKEEKFFKQKYYQKKKFIKCSNQAHKGTSIKLKTVTFNPNAQNKLKKRDKYIQIFGKQSLNKVRQQIRKI